VPKSWVTPSTGQLIRDFLSEVDEAYPKEIHAYLKTVVEAMGLQPPTYQSTRKFIYVLAKLDLIRVSRQESVVGYPTAFKRRYYTLTPGREEDPAWLNPYAALYYPTKFERYRKFPRPPPKEWMVRIRRG